MAYLPSLETLLGQEQRISAGDPASADHWIVRLTDSLAQAGYDVTGDQAMKQTAVFACVRVLSETIASLPYIIYERQGESKVPARDFYLFSLLHDAPNNFQTAFEFWEMVVAHICLRGNAYAFLERNQAGRILRIIPIRPDRVKVKMFDSARQILSYEITDDQGHAENFLDRDIWHMKGLSSDGFVGISPIQMASRAVQLAGEAERHGIQYYRHGARASGIAKLPGRLKPDAKKRLQDSVNDAMSGENKFKALVFEEGMDWQQLSLTNEDSQYLETRNFQVQEIARIYRVPSILIQHPDKTSTYASAEQFMLSFVTHTIRPWAVRLEQSSNRSLLTEAEKSKYFSKFKLDALLRGDTNTRYTAYSKARQGEWMSVNEIRNLEDMNPIEGGDVYQNPNINTVQEPEPEPGVDDGNKDRQPGSTDV